jgi:hypothetical protein
MSNFKLNLDNEKFDVECPSCNRKISFCGRDIDHDVTCSHCGASIYIDGKDFKKQFKALERQLDKLFG